MRIVIILFSCFSLLISCPAHSNPARTFVFSTANSPAKINAYCDVYHTYEQLSARQVYSRIAAGNLPKSGSNVSPGFSKDFFWIYFQVNNKSGKKLCLELNNPHIDYVALYLIDDGVPKLANHTGDRLPFDTRNIHNRRFVFDLHGDNSEYLLMVDKRFAAVSFPLKIWPREAFYRYESGANILFGTYFGILSFISLFAFFTGAIMRNKLFFSYGLYVLTVTLYILTQLGFSFQFLYPASDTLNNYSRVMLATFVTSSAIEFFRRFLEVRKYYPLLHKILSGIIIFLLSILLLWVIYKESADDYAVYTMILLNVLYLIIFVFIAAVVFIMISTWRLQKENIIFFATSFSAIIFGSIAYILIEYGFLPESNFPVNPILSGSIVEILILSISMMYRVKMINDRKNELTLRIAAQQKELMRAFVRGGEKERSRVSAELHDNIGSNLALLKSKIEKGDHDIKDLKGSIDQLCEDARTLSHQLMPHEMQIVGLVKTLESHCKKFQAGTGIKVHLDLFSFPNIQGELSLHLFRVIQEALQNIHKHANASEVEIQMIGYDQEIVITIDDNGEGFDTNHFKTGNGLTNMTGRVESLDGSFELASYPGKGTNILMKVPV